MLLVLLGSLVVAAPAYPWLLAVPAFLAVAGESFLPVLPLGPLVAVNVLVLGAWDGFLVSWLGALVGSCGAYGVSRLLGRGWVTTKIPERYRARADRLAANGSVTGLLLAWSIPGVNCVVACAAGVGGVSFARFLFTCALGLLPWIALYAALAHDLARAGLYGTGLAALGLALGALWLARRWRTNRRAKRPLA